MHMLCFPESQFHRPCRGCPTRLLWVAMRLRTHGILYSSRTKCKQVNKHQMKTARAIKLDPISKLCCSIAFCSPPGQAHAWLPGIVLLLFVVFVFLIVFFSSAPRSIHRAVASTYMAVNRRCLAIRGMHWTNGDVAMPGNPGHATDTRRRTETCY